MNNSVAEIEKTDAMFVIGSNTTENHPIIALRMKKAVQNGAKLVIADPRKIPLVKFAHLWLRHKPGTDITLINTMMHVILEEGLEDKKFIAERTTDFEAFRENLKSYTPEHGEKVTGVPKEDIIEAARVYAVDVGYGQLAWKLRQDERVVVIERTNIRNMPGERVPETVDIATIDVSFISLKIVVPAVMAFLKPEGLILALIKPQFEVGKNQVGKGGVVRNPELHDRVIEDLSNFFAASGLGCAGVVPSPILGPKGNREFFILLNPTDSTTQPSRKNPDL